LPNYGLIYRGEALPEDLTIAGAVRVTLHVQSSRPDTDFIAKLIDLHPDGHAMLLMDGVSGQCIATVRACPTTWSQDRSIG